MSFSSILINRFSNIRNINISSLGTYCRQIIENTPGYNHMSILTPRTPSQVVKTRIGTCEAVPQDGSASVDMEITDGLFHASFVAIRQL